MVSYVFFTWFVSKKTISAPRDFRSHTFGLFSQFLEQLGRAIGG
jgi:hypothetical protein